MHLDVKWSFYIQTIRPDLGTTADRAADLIAVGYKCETRAVIAASPESKCFSPAFDCAALLAVQR